VSLDLGIPLREAVLSNAQITSLLGLYEGEPAVFTRRPVPSEARYPMLVIPGDSAIGDQDFLVSRNPIVIRDLIAYGQQEITGSGLPDQYRDVEQIGYLLRDQFHREKRSISPVGYRVIDIVAAGPMVAPTEDVKIMGRVVSLTISLQKEQ
jgi:hypothetical protein